jgi:hypothetical protein
VFVQLLIHMGAQSQLRRVLSPLVSSQERGDPPASAVDRVLAEAEVGEADLAQLRGLARLLVQENRDPLAEMESPLTEDRPAHRVSRISTVSPTDPVV